MFEIKNLIDNGKNLVFRKNMRKSFRPFGTDNNVVGPVIAENLIEKEFERVARNIDVTVTNTGFNTMI
ncbi:MAG: hypothetical protein APF81_08350 [Desulfosporosinus sp. BRH_c37]|nr:MAG: hypothetical protein APF81_08350 [Desulfosporosinus sp. BRH_c37]